MAQSWMRLREGKNIQEHDIILLRHELMEAGIMEENPDMPYEVAHDITVMKYDYHAALIEYLKKTDLE